MFLCSLFTGITNNLGVASVSLNYHSNGTVTATYSNVSATCNVTSNYVPPTPIGWNMPLTSYTVTDPYDIISETYGEPYFAIYYFDSYIDNYEDLINYNNSDEYYDLGGSFYPEDFPIDITDEGNVNNGYWVNPIMIYLVNVNVYLLCSYELIDEDTLVAKVTDNIFE